MCACSHFLSWYSFDISIIWDIIVLRRLANEFAAQLTNVLQVYVTSSLVLPINYMGSNLIIFNLSRAEKPNIINPPKGSDLISC